MLWHIVTQIYIRKSRHISRITATLATLKQEYSAILDLLTFPPPPPSPPSPSPPPPPLIIIIYIWKIWIVSWKVFFILEWFCCSYNDCMRTIGSISFNLIIKIDSRNGNLDSGKLSLSHLKSHSLERHLWRFEFCRVWICLNSPYQMTLVIDSIVKVNWSITPIKSKYKISNVFLLHLEINSIAFLLKFVLFRFWFQM